MHCSLLSQVEGMERPDLSPVLSHKESPLLGPRVCSWNCSGAHGVSWPLDGHFLLMDMIWPFVSIFKISYPIFPDFPWYWINCAALNRKALASLQQPRQRKPSLFSSPINLNIFKYSGPKGRSGIVFLPTCSETALPLQIVQPQGNSPKFLSCGVQEARRKAAKQSLTSLPLSQEVSKSVPKGRCRF